MWICDHLITIEDKNVFESDSDETVYFVSYEFEIRLDLSTYFDSIFCSFSSSIFENFFNYIYEFIII